LSLVEEPRASGTDTAAPCNRPVLLVPGRAGRLCPGGRDWWAVREDGRMHIVVLAGGIGGARFLRGVRAFADARATAIVNVGDEVTLHGLRICPDLDSVMYTLGGGADAERGWGRTGETWVVKEELGAYGAEPTR